MPRRYRSAIPSTALALTVAGTILAVLSIGSFMVFMMDSMVVDIDEDDFARSGEGKHGPEYTAKAGSKVIGAMVLSVTDDDDYGWAWIKITEGGSSVQRLKNVSFPFTQQFPLEGRGDTVVTVVVQPGTGIDDLEIGLSVSGPLGLVGAITGLGIAGPCCAAWSGSLIVGTIGIYIAAVDRRRTEEGRWM